MSEFRLKLDAMLGLHWLWQHEYHRESRNEAICSVLKREYEARRDEWIALLEKAVR